MLSFNEKEFLANERAALSVKGEIEKVADFISEKGYKNLFLVGIGGTLSYGYVINSIMKSVSKIDVFVENAAEFVLLGNKHFSKDSIVVVSSVSGDTEEIVDAVNYAKEKGALIIGSIGKENSPLTKMVDFFISQRSLPYYNLYTIVLRFMYNAGEFPQYNEFFKEMIKIPEALSEVKKMADEEAKKYVDKYCDEPFQYLVGSGYLWGETYCYAMCVMEEMQWMRTKSIHAAEFFHGTLEVIDRNTSVILFKGEDESRPLMDRVEKFVNRVSEKVTVFDTKKYKLKEIDNNFRSLLSPFVMNTICDRISKHLENKRKHPLDVRRYYRKLDY